MNVLCIPQLSMYDKQTKKYLPMADGNINMLRNTITEWKKYRPEDKFFVLVPEEIFMPYIDLKIDCQYFTYKNSVISARINRFNFPMKEFIDIFKRWGKFDIILNDIIELTGNFRQMFKIEFGYEPKIISNIRHVDESKKSDYIYNVMAGIEHSDLVTILSESMKHKLWNQFVDTGIHIDTANKVCHYMQVFEPSVSYAEIQEYKNNAVVKEKNKVIITFPGRLSYGEERRTNWDKFFLALKELRKIRYDFKVYFTDPNNNLDKIYPIHEEISWIKAIPKDRKIFLNLLNNTDIIVSLMDIEGFGGISIREALLFNCRPVIPYKHEYINMLEDKDYPGYVNSPIEVDDLVNKLNWAIDQGHKAYMSIYGLHGRKYTVEEQFKNLIPKLEVLING